MRRNNCIFCNNRLDGSREHIIPECLNGRLTSTQIICSSCNKLFGKHIDEELKDQLNSILLFMGFKNARQVQVMGEDNRAYLLNKKLGLEPIRPEVYLREKKNKKGITISGTSTHIDGVLKKMNEILATKVKGVKFVAAKEKTSFGVIPSVHTPMILAITNNIKLLFNKIALEFLARNVSDLTVVTSLLSTVHALSENLNNVVFCNANNEIRDFESKEISHVLVIIGDSRERKLRAYIELFNIFCGVVHLSDSYTGDDVNYSYYQDAITGKQIDLAINLKVPLTSDITTSLSDGDLTKLSSQLSERQRDRYFSDALDLNLKGLLDALKEAERKGLIQETEIKTTYIQEAANIIGHLAVMIPYSVEMKEGQPPHEDDQYNFYHSNFKPDKVDPFIEQHQHLLRIKIIINEEMFKVASFYKGEYGINYNTKLTSLYAVLESVETKEMRYVPIRQLFEMLQIAKPVGADELEKYTNAEI